MKRAINEPSTSAVQPKRPALLTAEQVLDDIYSSDEDEREFDQVYPEESESDSGDSDDDRSVSDSVSIVNNVPTPISVSTPVPRNGRQQQTSVRVGGDNQENLDEGWGAGFILPDMNFNGDNLGPQNIPDWITNTSGSVDFFSLFLDDDFWANLAAMTTLRASQVRRDKPNVYYAKNFQDVSVVEMKAFIGIRLYMEYICVKTSYRDYWTNDGADFLGHTPGFRTVMKRDRFLAIWTYLHVLDEEDQSIDKRDKIYKVRPMMNELLPRFRHFYKPAKHLSLDEGMIPTKNRLGIKQYIRDKPTKWGIKSFLVCEGETGYIVNAEIYTGASEILEPELGAIGNTVARLVTSAKLENKFHILVMDRYYNSILLSRYLLDVLNTGAVGTMMCNRKHVPVPLRKIKKLPTRGDYQYLSRENITCMVWQDRKPIMFVSNYHDPTIVTTADRRNKDGSLISIAMPQAVRDYNTYMGGCDKNDQMTRLHRSRKHYRWPRRLFVKFFMWACYNSFVLFNAKRPAGSRDVYFTGYIRQLCLGLIGSFRSAIRVAVVPGNVPCEQRLLPGNHFPEFDAGVSTNHVCVVCSDKHHRFKRQNPGLSFKENPFKIGKTTIRCTLCQRYLCVKRGSACWADWHSKVQYWR